MCNSLLKKGHLTQAPYSLPDLYSAPQNISLKEASVIYAKDSGRPVALIGDWMCMDQILSCCVSHLQRVMSAENTPFAQRMHSFPLVLRHFAFFHDNWGLLLDGVVVCVACFQNEIQSTAGSVTPSSGTSVAIDISSEKDFSLFVNWSFFSVCDLPQQGWQRH